MHNAQLRHGGFAMPLFLDAKKGAARYCVAPQGAVTYSPTKSYHLAWYHADGTARTGEMVTLDVKEPRTHGVQGSQGAVTYSPTFAVPSAW